MPCIDSFAIYLDSVFLNYFLRDGFKPSKREDLVFYLIVLYISSIFIALFYRVFSVAHSIIRVLHFSTKKVLNKSANQVMCNGPSIFQKQAAEFK